MYTQAMDVGPKEERKAVRSAEEARFEERFYAVRTGLGSWVTSPSTEVVDDLMALRFGANDFGSLMMEENVVSAAGTTYRATIEEMERAIRDAGMHPARRRQDYSLIESPLAAVA